MSSQRAPRGKRGITLVELLVTITILSLLASIIVFAMSQAQDKARANRTEATIRKIDNIVTRLWESYQTRRVPLAAPYQYTGNSTGVFRLHCMRQMQMFEMPDRYNEILTLPSTDLPFVTPPGAGQIDTIYNSGPHRAYFIRCTTNSIANVGAVTPTLQNQSAECLYMIVTLPGAAGAVASQEGYPWGDVDNDGMREFVDGWGRPITYVRWPAGFATAGMYLGERQTGNVTTDHDPFDPLAVDSQAFRMHPLIFSAGPDGQDGIITNSSSNSNWSYRANGMRSMGSPAQSIIDPYASLPGAEGKIGQPVTGRDWRDNIHNHMQAYK